MLSVAKTAATALIKRADPAEAIRLQFEAAADEADRELHDIFRSVVIAIWSDAVGRLPSRDELDNLMAGAGQGPARAYRLLGEARKTTSRTRRQMLAAVLVGLSFSDMKDDDRDRVDMLVERLTTADVALLGAIHAFEINIPHSLTGWRNGLFAALIDAQLRIVPGHLVPDDGFDKDLLSVPNLPSDRVALVQLQALGLVDLGTGNQHGAVPVGMDVTSVNGLATTPLGHLLLQALHEVRSGIEATPV